MIETLNIHVASTTIERKKNKNKQNKTKTRRRFTSAILPIAANSIFDTQGYVLGLFMWCPFLGREVDEEEIWKIPHSGLTSLLGALLLTESNWARINNHTHCFVWDVITYPYPSWYFFQSNRCLSEGMDA